MALNLEQEIAHLVNEILEMLGYQLVKVNFLGKKEKTLQVMIKRSDKMPITLKDCEKVSHEISNILEKNDLIEESYNLEVSSEGAEKSLISLADFIENIGFKVSVDVQQPKGDNKTILGRIMGVEGNIISLRPLNRMEDMTIDFSLIESAYLIALDELLTATKH